MSQWNNTFTTLLRVRDVGFDYFAIRKPQEHVSDDELVHGSDSKQQPQILKLDGTSYCAVETNSETGGRFFLCDFFLGNVSAEKATEDYVRLVRLVEKASKSTVIHNVPPFVQIGENYQRQMVVLENGVIVTELQGSNSTLQIMINPTRTSPVSVPDVQSSVNRIEHSQHTSLPPLGSGTGAGPIAVSNKTAAVLKVYFSGPKSQTIVVQPFATIAVSLEAGTYKVAGELSNSSVLPFFGVRTYSGGESETFYIAPR